MARRNDHTREELIDLTLNKVQQFLTEHSYHELSLRKIANMIGYVPSTLINIFGSYNLLLLHAVAQTLDELSLEAKSVVCPSQTPYEALFQLAYCYHNFALTKPYRWQLIFEHDMNGEDLPSWQIARINAMTGMLEELLRRLSPTHSKSEISTASRVLWAGVHGITLLSVDNKFFVNSGVNGNELIDNLLSQYLRTWCN